MDEMTVAALLASLEDRGFTLRTEDGRLLVRPIEHLTAADREAIAECRDVLYRLVASLDAIEDAPDLNVDDPGRWAPIPCTECGQPAIRDGRHLCPPCLAAWQPAATRQAVTLDLRQEQVA